MSVLARAIVLLTAVLLLAGAASPTASAVTWHQTGDTAFTATAGAMTFGIATATFSCVSAGTTGTSPATGAGALGVAWTAAHLAVKYQCPLTPATDWTLSCRMTLTATGQAAGVTSGAADTNCTFAYGDTGTTIACVFHGATPMTYTNPAGTTTGRFVVPASSGGLRITDGPGGPCPLGTSTPLTVKQQALTVTAATGGPSAPHAGPVIARTA
jgi:hypothetical protein